MVTAASGFALAAASAVLTLLSLKLFTPWLPRRTNFVSRIIPTSAGAVFLPIILLTVVLSAAGVLGAGRGGAVLFSLYALAACLVGFVDDVWGGSEARGFRGHLGALARGRLTTGLVKLVVLGGGAVLFGVYVFGVGAAALVAAFLLAGGTNLANLFDVRPGRAIKASVVLALPLVFVVPGGAVLGLAGIFGGMAVLFPFDLRGRLMLGDSGAAVVGASAGYLAVVAGPGVVWWVAGVVILGLTFLAETWSISRLIASVGVLRWLDAWGREDE